MDQEKISVDQAIKKGEFYLTMPCIIIIVVVMAIFWTLVSLKYIAFFWGPLSILLGPILGTIYGLLSFNKWKIWAYSNVDDLEELTARAEDLGLIFRRGSFLEKLDPISSKQKAILNEIMNNYYKNYVFIDDPNVPVYTEFLFNNRQDAKREFILWVSISFIVFIICLIIAPKEGIYCFVINIFLLIPVIDSYRRMNKIEDKFSFDQSGITINDIKHRWADITNVQARVIQNYDSAGHPFLIYYFKGKKVKQILYPFELKLADFRHLLKIYKGRYENNNKLIN